MKKYKLIKKLPFEGSPPVGYISVEKEGEAGAHYWNHNWFHPEDYPEFWELVVEKDYEILALKSNEGKISDMYLNGMIAWSSDDRPEYKYPEEILKRNVHTINSVKRLSDSEIFTVGDRVDYMPIKNTKIESFNINNNKITVWGKFVDNMHGFVFLDGVSKSQKPILTTWDGIDIFNLTSQVWIVNSRLDSWATTAGDVICGITKTFSSYINANKYIEENKPQYSKKDMIDFAKSVPDIISRIGSIEHFFDQSEFIKNNHGNVW